MDIFDLLKCPLCSGRLHQEGKSFYCDMRHCFGISSSGYVNLLPPGRQRNAKTGDDSGMIRARAAFLAGGYYDEISRGIARFTADNLGNNTTGHIAVIDAGCGEGHHTCLVAQGLNELCGEEVLAVGFDASKHGANTAMKLAKRKSLIKPPVTAFFSVGNIFSLPVTDGVCDVLLSLFAPVPWDEASRVLKNDGVLIVAVSGREHLWELRELLYDEPRGAAGEVKYPDRFMLKDKQTVRYKIHLNDSETIKSLFTMTPFYYKTPESSVHRLEETEKLDVTVEVNLFMFVLNIPEAT